MTGQAAIGSDSHRGALVAIELVNGLVIAPSVDAASRLRAILAVDPPSVARLTSSDVEPFGLLAHRLRPVLAALAAGDVDTAATAVNGLLAEHPAHPHLANERGRWRLHHHPADMALLPMWHAICAEALARLIGEGRGRRVGVCAAGGCERVFLDQSKNASRRFCSLECQDRTKTAAFRRRRAAASG